MTDDVAAHVLADNYNQTLALSVARAARRRATSMPMAGSCATWKRAASWTARWNSCPAMPQLTRAGA